MIPFVAYGHGIAVGAWGGEASLLQGWGAGGEGQATNPENTALVSLPSAAGCPLVRLVPAVFLDARGRCLGEVNGCGGEGGVVEEPWVRCLLHSRGCTGPANRKFLLRR